MAVAGLLRLILVLLLVVALAWVIIALTGLPLWIVGVVVLVALVLFVLQAL